MAFPTRQDGADVERKNARPEWNSLIDILIQAGIASDEETPQWSPAAEIILPHLNSLAVDYWIRAGLREMAGKKVRRSAHPRLWNPNVPGGKYDSGGQFRDAKPSTLSRKESGAELLQPYDFVEYAFHLRGKSPGLNDLIGEVAQTVTALCGANPQDDMRKSLSTLVSLVSAAQGSVTFLSQAFDASPV